MTVYMSEEEYAELSEEYGGVCLACENRQYGVEPDARNYKCELCGEPRVFGAEEALLMGKIAFDD